MARYDVYKNADGDGYLLDIQANLLDGLNTRIVVPLLPRAHAPQPAERLNPIFSIADEDVVMVTQFLSSVPHAFLGAPVTSLEIHHTAIVNATDMLMQGF